MSISPLVETHTGLNVASHRPAASRLKDECIHGIHTQYSTLNKKRSLGVEAPVVSPTVLIAVNSEPLGRVSFKLFADKFPKTAENFHTLSTGEKTSGYKGSCFHKIIPGLMCQSGDFTRHNGTGGKSICGEKSDDENFIVKEGMNIVESMECFGSRNDRTSKKITSADCGQLQ
ncbi:hypothetical protein P7K49_009697 [Saguinus oedipus]|uniref:Peptidyl-prolyl cis-trans isomerase n=1 Tax=Saguinus oedipus TaxID=9490 RepID=A0ABQ9VKP7_SAGOE|nr:hypothetical protein P7K49_009697 [Saguinus oedipus]